MNLTELESLADAATKHPECRSTYVTVESTTIKQLIALCRLQHEALKNTGLQWPTVSEAVAAYEQMNGGE